MFTPTETPTAWFQPGEQLVHDSRGSAEDYATIHYRRPVGDYAVGGSTSGPERPRRRSDRSCRRWARTFGIEFRSLVDGADRLAYILHQGDTKDPGRTRCSLRRLRARGLAAAGANPEKPYVAPLLR